jgi:hypothetical protein
MIAREDNLFMGKYFGINTTLLRETMFKRALRHFSKNLRKMLSRHIIFS